MNTAIISYDKTDPISIFEYAKPLIGHTLREMVGDEAIQLFLLNNKANNKGELGQMVEDTICRYAIHLYATNGRRKHLETPFLCTRYNETNPLNRQIDSFWSRIQANGLSEEFLRDNVYTRVHCRGRSSNLLAS